jgi:hypothetical protein
MDVIDSTRGCKDKDKKNAVDLVPQRQTPCLVLDSGRFCSCSFIHPISQAPAPALNLFPDS